MFWFEAHSDFHSHVLHLECFSPWTLSSSADLLLHVYSLVKKNGWTTGIFSVSEIVCASVGKSLIFRRSSQIEKKGPYVENTSIHLSVGSLISATQTLLDVHKIQYRIFTEPCRESESFVKIGSITNVLYLRTWNSARVFHVSCHVWIKSTTDDFHTMPLSRYESQEYHLLTTILYLKS
jgi:hypothetical protein